MDCGEKPVALKQKNRCHTQLNNECERAGIDQQIGRAAIK